MPGPRRANRWRIRALSDDDAHNRRPVQFFGDTVGGAGSDEAMRFFDRRDLDVLAAVAAIGVTLAVSVVGFAAALGFAVRVFQWAS